jgi:hypothetical protein
MSKIATPPVASPTGHIKVPHDKIALRAHDKWVKRGRPNGTHVQDWLEAERELQAEFARAAAPTPRR